MEDGKTPQKPNIRATTQNSDQRSKMQEPKQVRYDAGESK